MSVIIPAYGHADYIVASVESVLQQDPPPREVIVIDDSSPDDTAARLAHLVTARRITYHRQPNAGMAAARNVGARMATSPYLYFLDDDDLMFTGALRWMVDELDARPAVAMVTGDMVVFDGIPPAKPLTSAPVEDVDPLPFRIFNQLGSPGQVLIRRDAFLAVGAFDPSIWGVDDWDLWLRLLDRYPARVARRPVLAYRLHENNASRNVARMYESSLRVARQHAATLPSERRTVLRRYTYMRLRRYHAPRIARMLKGAATRGDWRQATAAARAWTLSWANEGAAYLALKLHLMRRGRWSMPAEEPLSRVIVQHCGRL
ncbi:MAG TPA: glycosyltransferase family A protein [Gemmatimonadaceae bacterium]|nr:glycosyltransferase family A protein [Gemmatimonadaceae bacterium]